MIKQRTYDLLDLDLRPEYNRYKNMPSKDRFKLFLFEKLIDPIWADVKYKEIEKYKLKWGQVFKYSDNPDLDSLIISNDPGIYFFFVRPKNQIIQMPNFITYVGIAGEQGPRPIKDRLKDYYYISKIRKRSNIHQMFQIYYNDIYFTYAHYNGSASKLKTLETSLTEYFQPPWSSRDYEPATKKKKSAWVKK